MLIFRKLNAKAPIFQEIKSFFLNTIEPLYGSQEHAIQKIAAAKDRICIVLTQGTDLIGFIVFKKTLTNEFRKFGLHNFLETKTLALVNPESMSGKRYGSLLLLCLAKEAIERSAHGIFVTVSSGKPEAYEFFKKNGFKIIKKIKNLYKTGFDEYFFIHNDPAGLINSLNNKIEHASLNTPPRKFMNKSPLLSKTKS